jgi:peptidyl-prolyl cis-trans isomerase D
MLKVLRENVKYLSWILWVVIALFVLAIFVDFGAGMRQNNALSAEAARVGNEPVTREEFERQYKALKDRVTQMYGDQATPALLEQMQLPFQALNAAVDQKLLVGEARRSGFQASDSEVRDLIAQNMKDGQGHFVGEDVYKDALARNGYTPASFEDEVRRDILINKLDTSMIESVWVSDSEVERSYRDQVERAKIRYIEVPLSQFPQAAQVPQSDVNAYFQAHRQEYRLPERRTAAYMLIEPGKLRDAVKIDDSELQSYYDDHKIEFTQQEQLRARQILILVNDKRPDAEAKNAAAAARQRIEKGEDFATVAKQVSDDQGSKPNGGDMGYITKGHNIKEFEDAAFVAPTGKLVGPIKSPLGYHLLEVTERKSGGVKPFNDVKDIVKAEVSIKKSRDLAESKSHELAQQIARDKPKDVAAFNAFAKNAVGITTGETGKLGRTEPIKGVGMAPAFETALFALKKGEATDAIQTGRGWIIGYLEDIDAPHLAELSEIEPRVRAALGVQKQQQAAMDRLSQARKDLDSGKTIDQVAGGLGTAAKDTPEFGAQGSIPGLGNNPQLAKAALALDQGKFGGPVVTTQGAILFQVTQHQGWDPAKFALAKEQTRTQLQSERLQRLKRALIEQRRRELGVTYNQQLMQTIGGPAGATPQG